MGTHPSGPSKVELASGKQQPLSEYLGTDLPFLFKVLSVKKALSIQAHPDAALAGRLHTERPQVYKDPHHKPELACALTPFEAMCAFRPIEEIQQHARDYPEFAALMGAETVKALLALQGSSPAAERKATLKRVFSAMMTPKETELKKHLEAMLARLKAAGVKALVPASEQHPPPSSAGGNGVVRLDVASLMVRLSEQYPGDLGIFAPLYLNAFSLSPGQSIFLGPNEPHAYLSGDCMECMAGSDNVVRAGLTPKLRDTDVLVQMLTYETHTVESTLMKGRELGQHTICFQPPKEFTEFRLLQTRVKAHTSAAAGAAAASSAAAVSVPSVVGPSIALCWSGEGRLELLPSKQSLEVQKGTIVLIPSGERIELQSNGKEDLVLYQCASNPPHARG